MTRRASLFLGLAALAVANPAFAAPATAEGAQKLLDGYSAYIGRSMVGAGIVAVEPNGDDYVVTWNLQKAAKLLGLPDTALQVDPLVYRLSLRGDHAWSVRADRLPNATFATPKDEGEIQTTAKVEFVKGRVLSDYDEAAPSFLHSSIGFDKLILAFRGPNAGSIVDYQFVETDAGIETSVNASATYGGVDVTIARSAQSVKQALSLGREGDAPLAANFNIGPIAATIGVDALRASALDELWRYFIAAEEFDHYWRFAIGAEEGAPGVDLRPHLKAVLPLFARLPIEAKAEDLSFDAGFGQASMKTFSEKFAVTGAAAHASADLALTLDGLNANSLLMPSWAKGLWPLSADLKASVGFDGLDKMANLAIDDPRFSQDADVSAATGERIASIWQSGHPKLTIGPTSLKTPIVDLRVEGSAGLDARPSGHFHVSVDSLDKTMALLQDAGRSLPEAVNALQAMTLFKGLATTGADGRLAWDVDVSDTGLVINGKAVK